MASDLSIIIDFIEFINDAIGSTEKITIDSGIYAYDDNNGDKTHKPKNSKPNSS